MRPIHYLIGVGVIAAAAMLYTGGVKTAKTEACQPRVGGVACQEPACGDAQCVPSILGEDQYEGTRPRNNQQPRKHLFPRLHRKTSIED